ncbi:MAG: hypothetical protein J6L85_06995 [Clostridia bacterium]|nr:hypothetical protein [Clostridia bacterium]
MLILLIRWLMLLPLSEEEQLSIAMLLETDEERIAIMDYLSENRTPTHDEIMNEVGRIIKSTKKKSTE